MSKLILYFILFLIGIQCSCVSKKNIGNNANEVFIEDKNQIIGLSLTKYIKNPHLFETIPEIINVENYIFYEGHQPHSIPFMTYGYTFVNKKDTMEITISDLDYRENYFFDNIKFKKGSFYLKRNSEKMRNDKIYSKRGKDIFKDNKTLLKTKVIYKPNDYYKGKIILLKDMEFRYYDFKQKDFSLEKIKK